VEPHFRIGQGFDVHPFAEGRPCILGGIEIPSEKGLAGHSDADVLVHAVMDALLGAIGEADIGVHFPDTDHTLRGIDSCVLLEKVAHMLHSRGWGVGNIDVTVLAEVPRISPYVTQMREKLSRVLAISVSQITIKATTTEKLSFVGRREGIAAMAVALVVRTGQ
jgi:2-C-methyl-D-erythritol 2,4-cyclodiphosphate synthase